MKTLSDLEKKVDRVLFDAHPHTSVRTGFRPLAELSFGDAGSDVLLRLSSESKGRPDALAGEFLAALDDRGFSYSNGFLNYRGPNDRDWLLHHEGQAAPRPITVFVPQCRAYGSYARLLSAAFLQCFEARRLGGDASILLPDGRVSPFELQNRNKLFLEALGSVSNPRTPADSVLHRFIETNPGRRIFVWASQDNGQYSVAPLLKFPERDRTLFIRIPDKAWAAGSSFSEPADWFEEAVLRRASLMNLLFYLSDGRPFDDLDASSVLLKEHANTWWFMRLTQDRISSHVSDFRDFEEGEVSPIERTILIRLKYMETFRSLAAEEGAVVDYVTVLGDMLRSFNRFFNGPAFRARLAASRLTRFEAEIISGMSERLGVLLSV